MGSRFAILRVQKVKSMEALRAGMRHVFREQDTPNADPDRLSQNTTLVVKSTKAGLARAESIIPEKRRKDAVIALEYLVTASPEALKAMGEGERYDYFNRAWQWLVKRHGAANVIGAAVHRDETSEHMHVYVVPKIGDRLCAKEFMGGPKGLAMMQTKFATCRRSRSRRQGCARAWCGSRAGLSRSTTWWPISRRRWGDQLLR